MTGHDSISYPSHYVEGRSIEPIEVIEDWGLGFQLGNALKYIARSGRKGDEVQDLRKAIWYLDRRIRLLEDVEGIAEASQARRETVTGGKVEVTFNADSIDQKLVADSIQKALAQHHMIMANLGGCRP